MDLVALGVTIRLALFTTLALAVIGLPLAWWLANTRFRGKAAIEAVVALPLVLPPTVVGFYLLTTLGPRGPLGAAFKQVTGDNLPFTFTGILIGSIVYHLPFAVRPFVGAFSTVDRRWIEASWSLGASGWRTFWEVVVPLSWPGILTGLVLPFAHAMGEFGVVLLLGGNIPGVTRTLSMCLYDDVQALDYCSAHQTALVLVVVALVVLSITYYAERRVVRR